jgi:inner membrane protein
MIGIALVLAEFALPGLVAVFVGMGAMTVALLLQYGIIEGAAMQFIALCVSSIVYIFSLRILVIRFYPSDRMKHNVDEDVDVVGGLAKVVEALPADGVGRVEHGESTWQARAKDGSAIAVGVDVQIVGRDNITWIVERVSL